MPIFDSGLAASSARLKAISPSRILGSDGSVAAVVSTRSPLARRRRPSRPVAEPPMATSYLPGADMERFLRDAMTFVGFGDDDAAVIRSTASISWNKLLLVHLNALLLGYLPKEHR